MGEIVKFPVQATKLGYKRVRKRAAENPNQLSLFPQAGAKILEFTAGLSRFEQALLFDERGDVHAADLYVKAIEEHDCVADAWCNLGIIESQRGNTTKAFNCFTTSLQHDPRHSEAHYNLGNLYFDVHDLRLAQVHYEMAGAIDPAFPNVYFNLALVQAINNDLAAAAASLAKYEQLVPPAEARHANELLVNLKKTLNAAPPPRFGAS